jgi:hypothetical protein
VLRVLVDERAGRLGERVRVGAVPDRELQAVLGDQRERGRLVVDGDRDERRTHRIEFFVCPLERPKLRVAVRAPGAPVEQHHAVAAREHVGQVDRVASGQHQGKCGERVADLKRHQGPP